MYTREIEEASRKVSEGMILGQIFRGAKVPSRFVDMAFNSPKEHCPQLVFFAHFKPVHNLDAFNYH